MSAIHVQNPNKNTLMELLAPERAGISVELKYKAVLQNCHGFTIQDIIIAHHPCQSDDDEGIQSRRENQGRACAH